MSRCTTRRQLLALLHAFVLSRVLLCLGSGCQVANASTVSVSLPAVGTCFNSGSFSFADLNGTSLSGQSLDLEFEFDGDKALAYQRDLSDTAALIRVALDIGFVTSLTNPSSGSLLDSIGDAISPATDFLNVGDDGVGVVYYNIGYSSSLADLDETPFFGAEYSITLPNTGGTINAAALEVLVADAGQFTVVPEPSSFMLTGIGLLGMVIFALRRRSAAARLMVLAGSVWFFTSTATAANITIDTVPVGNLGNGADTTGFGAVSYAYNIGTIEVTNAQYVSFLNEKAKSDPLGLYNTSMGSGFGGITRSGSSGSYSYAALGGREDMPVNYVSWYDSIRFANWLHNGQGTGDTESGAYTLLGGTPTPSNGQSITRNTGAHWWLTSEDEWYKAAYHKNDGDTANYFEYPTSSDTVPTAEAPAGGTNSANYDFVVGDLTDVGAYVDSDSPYGTFDQGGNVWEWNESLVSGPVSYRGLRGGTFVDSASFLSASFPGNLNGPSFESPSVGFRVATVPEPSSLALAGMGLVGSMLLLRRRPK